MTTIPDAGLDREIAREVEHQTRNIEEMIAQHALTHEDFGPRRDASIDEVIDDVEVPPSEIGRREFVRGSVAVASSVAIAGTLQLFHARKAHAKHPKHYSTECPYGDPAPTPDEVTGLPLIGLPPGFRYWSYGWTGDRIFPHFSQSPLTPPMHDGMAVLKQIGPWAILCRNHEAGTGPSYVGGRLEYSPAAAGGNTNVIFDTHRRKFVAGWPTLSGTVRNCAGGPTPHASWLSCEETDVTTTDASGRAYTHGWVFDVPAIGTSNGKPIKEMGRRNHEAAAVDPRTGHVYLTEDAAPGGVYRFMPNRTHRREAPYSNGGKLQMLAIDGMPNAVLTGLMPRFLPHGIPYPVPLGTPLDIAWVDIDDPTNEGSLSNFAQGDAKGGATFQRPEGCWYDGGKLYFVATDGGDTGNGQVFEIDLKKQTLTLIYDAPLDANGAPSELDNPDNLTVTPRGGLLFCEDNSGSPELQIGGISTERLVALTRNGDIFTFATNLCDFRSTADGGLGPYTRPGGQTFSGQMRGNEWAGATFDRTGKWLFVNIQTPGVTFAITGPWHRGPL